MMFGKKVVAFPNFKKNATTAERLYEMAQVAELHPDQFNKWVLVYVEDNDKRCKVRYMNGPNTRTSDCFGVLALGQQHIWEDSRK